MRTRGGNQPKLNVDLSQAVRWHRSGELGKAEKAYRQILKVCPAHAEALHLHGLIAYQRRDYINAVQLIRRAIACDCSNPDFFCDLGLALKGSGEIGLAREAFLEALKHKPDCANSAYNLGNLFFEEGALDKAIQYYRLAISSKTDFYQAYTNLAAVFNAQGAYQEALRCCRAGIKFAADDTALLINLGNALKGTRQYEEAAAAWQRAIELDPGCTEALSNLGNLFHETGRLQQAMECYSHALRLTPQNEKIINNLGTLYNDLGRSGEAELCFLKAIHLRPTEANPYHNLGNLHLSYGRCDSAIRLFAKAIALNPRMMEAYVGQGIALQQKGNQAAALSCFEQAVAIAPNCPKPYCHLVRSLQHLCRWEELKNFGSILDKFTAEALERNRRPDEMPFLYLTRSSDLKQNYRVARAWSDYLNRRAQPGREKVHAGLAGARLVGERIRLGYLSNNFKNHPTAHLIGGLFRLHDRSRFDVACYSYGEDDGSLYRRQIESDCDRFVDLQAAGHIEAASRIAADKVDILIDLVGYMKNNRMEIPALRPAPVQVRWLGMAGTCGADFFDYIITDRYVTPEQDAGFYAETFALMPHTYQFNNHPEIIETGRRRQDFGLPEKSFVFASFCSTYKLDQILYRTWMSILEQVQGSVLWLLSPAAGACDALKAEARQCGIDPARIIFAGKIERLKHLSRLRHADLCLDTRLVNGALTTSEALWAGVPVITLQGRHFASRMGSSILSALDLPELITTTLGDYERLAVRLGLDREYYKRIRDAVTTKKKAAALFDSASFVKNLETLFEQMRQCQKTGQRKKIICSTE